ncbi:Ppx/GppA phosphatase family protein [Fodinibius sp.]|uniref:Ppx/GppA phosphatase family protein n=1 Tax=Fodinibius sp. TaxID=1872440 RepID=UPI002ACE2FBB|nr:Ppx/GppA phosphatase family protein [Fodinibius sp.]MDZ7660166.1 Ppx/GppA phosphatase family protein [Fodinibius sp.]
MKASIDIGTNTVLLLVAEVGENNLKIIEEQQRVPRLGAGVDDSKELSNEAMQRVIESLKDLQEIVNENYPGVSDIFVTATSAVRDANNRAFFIDLVEQETGLQIEVLSGVEEAEYTFLGAQSVLDNVDGPQMIIDIGGGSTEIAYGENDLQDRYSYDMGCVRFTERFLKSDPPADFQMQQCRNEIKRVLAEHEFNVTDQTTLIGVAGTVTSLAFIDLELCSYEAGVLSGHIITKKKLEEYIIQFSDYTSDALEQEYPVVMKGRADIFLAGLLILDEFMNEYNFGELITSTGGIRHGTILVNKGK